MDDSQLRSTLEQLHAQLEQTQTVDDESRQLLQHLMGDIQMVLKDRDATPQQYRSLGRRLEQAVSRFESTHSGLTLTIKQVLDHLAQV